MRYELYRDDRHEWRWRCRTANGNVVADSGQGYAHRGDCERGIQLVKGSSEAPVVDMTTAMASGEKGFGLPKGEG